MIPKQPLRLIQSSPAKRPVNNEVYDALDERWYTAVDDPIALLRAEAAHRAPWISDEIRGTHRGKRARVLDAGCGAGFLANALARNGFDVTGLDLSPRSLAVARRHDTTRTVRYVEGDARQMPFPAGSFDVVCAMDLLEHVEEPGRVVAEAARLLADRGLFFFHTFNRNVLSWLVVIKGVEWFVKNTPERLHALRLFLKPSETRMLCEEHGLDVRQLRGFNPDVTTRAFWQMLWRGRVPEDFRFRFTESTSIGYSGLAVKQDARGAARPPKRGGDGPERRRMA